MSMKKKILGVAAIAVVGLSMLAFVGGGEPDDYNDCILENMKGVESSVAAKLIRNACSDKFHTKKTTFTHEELYGSQ